MRDMCQSHVKVVNQFLSYKMISDIEKISLSV